MSETGFTMTTAFPDNSDIDVVPFQTQLHDETVALTKSNNVECFADFDTAGYVKTEFVALCDNKTVGYSAMLSFLDSADICSVCVDKDFRRKGIGFCLLESLLCAAKNLGVTAIHLEVRESNLTAILLYEKAGFRRVGMRRGYYKNPTENGVLMDYEISGI